MKSSKFMISVFLAGVLAFAQVSAVFAAPVRDAEQAVSGTIQSITLEADPSTGLTTVLVTVLDAGAAAQTVRISIETATELGLVLLDGDGNPIINQLALGQSINISSELIIQDEKLQPVASALSTFFSDVDDLDYELIMEAHSSGNGFGVIAQALWLTRRLEGTASDFLLLLDAKKNNDFSAFVLEDGTTPTSWGQLRKAIMDGDKNGNLGLVMSNNGNRGNHGNGNRGNRGNHGNGNGDGNNNGNGNGNGNGNRP